MQALLVPVKSFATAKQRLVGTLCDEDRRRLAQQLARTVFQAREHLPLFVACDDDEVAEWASTEGAEILWTAHLGLSGAVRAGVTHLGLRGFDRAIVAHADLPFAHSLTHFGEHQDDADSVVSIAPDRRIDGTNVISVPTHTQFTFAYGPRSYRRHLIEARVRGLSVRTVFDWRLATDIDLPEDLSLMTDLITMRGIS